MMDVMKMGWGPLRGDGGHEEGMEAMKRGWGS